MIFSIVKYTCDKGKTLIKKRSIVTWNPKWQTVRIPLKIFCNFFKTLYNYCLLWKAKLFVVTIKRLWPKALEKHSRLRNKYNKNKTPKNWMICKKQRNKCVKILSNVKRKYLSNLKIKDVTNKRKLWSTGRPFISDSSKTVNNIMLNNND